MVSATTMMALNPKNAISQYAHSSWSRENGSLPGPVYALAQTTNGALWLGTETGLFRFDGIAFTLWEPPTPALSATTAITALAADRDGGLWIGSRNGLDYWGKGSLQRVTLPNTVPAGVTAIVADHAGSAWVATAGFRAGGVCYAIASRSECTAVGGLEKEGAFSLFVDRDLNLWAGGVNGLYQRSESSFRRYAEDRTSDGISGIAQLNDGSIVWTGSQHGPRRLEGGRPAPFLTGAGHVPARVLLKDHDGALWIGTIGQGLVKRHNGVADRYTRADGLSGDTIYHLFEDSEGSIWAATGAGVDRFRDFPVVTLTTREGLSVDTAGSVAAASNGDVWIGTTKELNLVRNGRVFRYGKRNGLPMDSIGSILEDHRGVLWVDSAGGLSFGTAEGGFRRLNLPGGRSIVSVTAAAEDRTGDLWLSDREHGLISLRNGTVVEVVPWATFGNRVAWSLALTPDGSLLMGFGQGFAVWRSGRAVRWYTAADGLGEGAITDIQMLRDHSVWIATQSGVSRFHDGLISTLGKANGLACDHIQGMIVDDDGALWLNTQCGLVRIAQSDLGAWSANPQFQTRPRSYGFDDGMRVRSQLHGYFRRAVKSSDGRLWFPVFDGVAIIDIRHLGESLPLLPVEIDHLSADGKVYSPQTGIVLPPGTRVVVLDYTAFSFIDPAHVRFRYRLEPQDAEWREAGTRRQVSFSDLSPGGYRFRVAASRNGDRWYEAAGSLDFAIEPAYYQTSWFRAFCICGLGAAGWLLHRLRLRQQESRLGALFQARLNERIRIAGELHDSLLQNIAGFAYQLETLCRTIIGPPQAKDELRELCRNAKEWQQEARAAVAELRSPDYDTDNLGQAIEKLGKRVIGDKPIAFHMAADSEPKIAAQTRYSLLRIVEEAIRNAVRHAAASAILVEISCPDAVSVRIRVSDDGSGFDVGTVGSKQNHWGLKTMRERADSLNASFQLDTQPGSGTRIEIRCPIPARPE